MATRFGIDGQEIDGAKRSAFWIQQGLDRTAILFAEKFGAELTGRKDLSSYKKGNSDALSTSQIRNFYGEVLRLKMKGFSEVEFLMLKPRLAYASERNSTQGSKDFRRVIEPAIDAVLSGVSETVKSDRFERFANFFEAILAYHRAFGGK